MGPRRRKASAQAEIRPEVCGRGMWASCAACNAGSTRRNAMGLAILILVLALLIGGISLAVEALWWMVIIAVGLAVLSAVLGFLRRA